jgi:hypothetical protein
MQSFEPLGIGAIKKNILGYQHVNIYSFIGSGTKWWMKRMNIIRHYHITFEGKWYKKGLESTGSHLILLRYLILRPYHIIF